jgi:putative ABC transport system permease protein
LVNYWNEIDDDGYWANVHGPLKELLEDNVPEVSKAARVVYWSWGDAGANHIRPLKSILNEYYEGFVYADPEILDILDIPLRSGDSRTALFQPNSIVISSNYADTHFQNEDPIGKQLILNEKEETIYTVTGVMDNRSRKSHFKPSFILTLFERKEGPGTSGWCCTNYNMYVKLKSGSSKVEVEEKLKVLRNSLVVDNMRNIGVTNLEEEIEHQTYYLQNVADIYLNPEEVGDDLKHGSIYMISSFTLIALVILLLAGINFVNLTSASAIRRFKEIGIMKILGSGKKNIIRQFLVESIVFAFISAFLGLAFSGLLLPIFNKIAETSLHFPWAESWIYISLFLTSIVFGILSGIFPAIYLSSLVPTEVLKGKTKKASYGKIRSALVTLQFTASTILIVGSIILHRQFELFMNKSLGYDHEQVITILGLESMSDTERNALKSSVSNHSAVKSATLSDFIPVDGGRIQNRQYWDLDKKVTSGGFEAARWVVDEHYLKTMGIELLTGRDFRSEDEGNGLWKVYNRIQENLIKPNMLTSRKGKRIDGVHSFKQQTKINNALFSAVHSFA